IEAVVGEQHRLPNGKPDYARVQMILLGVVFGFVIVLTMIGSEERGKDFMKADDQELNDTENMKDISSS
ncbi:hypothetical protein CPB97_009229, partial [Podila verticillata]